MSFGWDAFGRLAFGQIQQNYAATSIHLGGVSASGASGQITPNPGGNPHGVVGTSSAGSFTDIDVKTISGVSGTASPGTPIANVSANLSGVLAHGHFGFFGFTPTANVQGQAGTGVAGAVIPRISNFSLIGVEGDTAIGAMLGAETLFSVFGTGRAGQITVSLSGGGGKAKKLTTGLEQPKKPRPEPPAPVRLPTYAIPNFRPRPPAAEPKAGPTPFDRPKGVTPLDFKAMRDNIRAAQDSADVKAVLEFLDANDVAG